MTNEEHLINKSYMSIISVKAAKLTQYYKIYIKKNRSKNYNLMDFVRWKYEIWKAQPYQKLLSNKPYKRKFKSYKAVAYD